MNVSKHRQAVLIFGVVLPFAVLLGLTVASLKARAKIGKDYATKVANFEAFEAARTQVTELDAFLSTNHRREEVAYWQDKLGKDFIQTLTENLNRMLAKYDSDVLRQTAMGQASGGGGFGNEVDNPSSRIQISFEGGFKPMQMLLAELEAEMPQLVLESINVNVIPAKSEGETGSLGFNLVYLCWEKPRG